MKASLSLAPGLTMARTSDQPTMYAMASPTSVRFDPSVTHRLTRFLSSHPGLSTSSAANLLVDEGLRSQEHPSIVFRDGPAGRRAQLVGGPDVWEVVAAVISARSAEPDLDSDAVVRLVEETGGVPERLIRAAIDYWTAYPSEIDGWVARARAEAAEAEARWRRQQHLLGS